MASYVRFLGKLRSSPAVGLNKNVHQIASSRLFSATPHLSVAIQKPSSAPHNKPPPSGGRKDPLDTSFNDPIAAFKSKTTFELIRGYLVYMICSSETLVENNMKVSSRVIRCRLSTAPISRRRDVTRYLAKTSQNLITLH